MDYKLPDRIELTKLVSLADVGSSGVCYRLLAAIPALNNAQWVEFGANLLKILALILLPRLHHVLHEVLALLALLHVKALLLLLTRL